MNRPHLDPLSPSITEESSHPSFQTHNLYWSYITARDGKACFSCWFFLHLPHYLRYMRHIILNTDIYIYTHTALSSLFYIYIINSVTNNNRLSMFSAATYVIPQAFAQKRCSETLHKTGCKLYDCKKECFQKHGENSGLCVATPTGKDYSCLCSWNCWVF